jgi:hypothetical protein
MLNLNSVYKINDIVVKPIPANGYVLNYLKYSSREVCNNLKYYLIGKKLLYYQTVFQSCKNLNGFRGWGWHTPKTEKQFKQADASSVL